MLANPAMATVTEIATHLLCRQRGSDHHGMVAATGGRVQSVEIRGGGDVVPIRNVVLW
jgi:hypothetical protein